MDQSDSALHMHGLHTWRKTLNV